FQYSPHFVRFRSGGGLLGGAEIERSKLDPSKSVLSQFRDPNDPQYELLRLMIGSARLHRSLPVARGAPIRIPQLTDLPSDVLSDDGGNLALIVNRIQQSPAAKKSLLKYLSYAFEGARDVDAKVHGGTVQLVLEEDEWVVPATRMSDGTLRWIALLAILLDPEPGGLVCIEEPEIGLHPDLMPKLAELLRVASGDRQLVVTTHSDTLIDALQDTPEAILVCERHGGSTTIERLKQPALSEWMKKYSLGQLWTRGDLGGTRW
ncbi:MAG: AAA family ATPase, partial [Myxococcaceae bacterium]|nr:AAA family ATPase [Myxococcaceae bacterium]